MSCRLAGVRRACALRARVTTNTARYSMTRQATVAIVAATSASASSTDVSFNVAQHSGSAPLPVCTPCSVRVGFGAQKSRPGGAVPLPAGRRNGQCSAGGCKRPFVVCSTVNTMNLTAPHAFTLLGAQSRNNARMIHAAFRPGKCRTMITGRRAPTRSERSRGRRKLPPARAASGLDGRVLAQHERMGYLLADPSTNEVAPSACISITPRNLTQASLQAGDASAPQEPVVLRKAPWNSVANISYTSPSRPLRRSLS